MLEEEFFQQGDRERDLGLPISPLFDRAKQGVSKSQVGFYDFVALPLVHALSSAFPGAHPLMKCFLRNYNHWRLVDGQAPVEMPRTKHALPIQPQLQPQLLQQLAPRMASSHVGSSMQGRPTTGPPVLQRPTSNQQDKQPQQQPPLQQHPQQQQQQPLHQSTSEKVLLTSFPPGPDKELLKATTSGYFDRLRRHAQQQQPAPLLSAAVAAAARGAAAAPAAPMVSAPAVAATPMQLADRASPSAADEPLEMSGVSLVVSPL